MQEVSATSSAADYFDSVKTGSLVDTSSQARAFSDFLGLLSQQSGTSLLATADANSSAAHDLTPYFAAANSKNSDTTATDATQTLQSSTTSSQANLATRNTPVTRESFEESRDLLAKAGLSDSKIEDLSAKVQAGTLTWGQLVQSVGGHLSGGKESANLDAAEMLSLQTFFQKLGYTQEQSGKLAKAMNEGDGQQVFGEVMSKLSNMDSDSSPGLDKDELSTFFKAMKVPQTTADSLTEALGEDATAAQLENAFTMGAQAVQKQFAKTSSGDAKLAKSLGAIMEKDAAKAERSGDSTGEKSGQDSGGPKVAYELKTKGKDDTSFFDRHEKSQDQKANADAWNEFTSKVRSDDSSGQSTTKSSGQDSAKSALQDLLSDVRSATGLGGQTAAQSQTQTAQQTKPYSAVQAPKILSQVTDALLKDLGEGRKQLSLSLEPENLGQVDVTLQVKGKEVTAVLHAENSGTANMLTSQMQNIRKSLEDQGLTVQNLEVQSGLTSNQQQDQYFTEEHNQAQERQEMSKIMSRLRLLRSDGSGLVQGVQDADIQAIFADSSLHLIA